MFIVSTLTGYELSQKKASVHSQRNEKQGKRNEKDEKVLLTNSLMRINCGKKHSILNVLQ